MAPVHSQPSQEQGTDGDSVAKKRCKCGSTSHSRTSSKECRLYVQKPALPAKAVQLDENSKGASEWSFLDAPDEYTLELEQDSLDNFFFERAIKDLGFVKAKTNQMIANQSEEQGTSGTYLPIFFLLSRGLFETVFNYARQKSRVKKWVEIKEWEILSFLAILIGIDMLPFDFDSSMELLSGSWEKKTLPRDPLDIKPFLTKERFLEIQRCLTVFDPDGENTVGNNFRARVDTLGSKDMRDFEERVFRDTRRMFLNEHSVLVLDDELIGSQSKTVESRAFSYRKADGKCGFKNDAIGTSPLGVMLAVRHKERLGYNQKNAAKQLLVNFSDVSCFTADRGYSCLHLWKHLLGMNCSFVMIANRGKSVGHPFRLASEEKKCHKSKERKEEMRRALLTATKKADERTLLTARTFDEEQKYANADAQEDLSDGEDAAHDDPPEHDESMAIGGTQEESESESEAMDEIVDQDTSQEELIASQETIYVDEGEIVDVIEEGLVSDTVLKAWPKNVVDDDWEFGKEIFTATCEQSALQGAKGKLLAFVFRDYTRRNQDAANALRFVANVDDDIAKRFSNTLCMERLALPLEVEASNEVLFFPGRGNRSDACSSMEQFLLPRCTPLTCWQRCADWYVCRQFIVTGTIAQKLARIDPAASKLLLRDGRPVQRPSLQVIAHNLFKAWVYKSFTGTPAMKTGTMNERDVFLNLRSQSWCSEIFECGLFVSKEHPCIGASPDGVARVRRPGSDQVVECSVEIKTRSGVKESTRADQVFRRYGDYFEVDAGSDHWFCSIPRANRSQVLTQAVVLDVDYVLYTESIPGVRIYSALVHVDKSQREVFAESINTYSQLMDWAISSLTLSGPPPFLPDAFSDRAKLVLTSHLRLWRSVRKLIITTGNPLQPVRLFKALFQVYYCKMKGGIDLSTKYVKALNPLRKKEMAQDSENLVICRAIKQLVVNTVIAKRILATDLTSCADHRTLFRRLSDQDSMNVSALSLSSELARYVYQMRNRKQVAQVTGQAPELPESTLTRDQIQIIQDKLPPRIDSIEAHQTMFNSGDFKKLRLCRSIIHSVTRIGHAEHMLPEKKVPIQKICVVCAQKTTYQCTTCNVPLHLKPNKVVESGRAGTEACAVRWHNNEKIAYTTEMKKKRDLRTASRRDSYKKKRVSLDSAGSGSGSSGSSVQEELLDIGPNQIVDEAQI